MELGTATHCGHQGLPGTGVKIQARQPLILIVANGERGDEFGRPIIGRARDLQPILVGEEQILTVVADSINFVNALNHHVGIGKAATAVCFGGRCSGAEHGIVDSLFLTQGDHRGIDQ